MQTDPILALCGRDLGNGWRVGKLLKAGPVGSGGHFSICYLAEHASGSAGFLKLFDFRSAVDAPDFMRALQSMTTAYNFERDLLDFCNNQKMKRVVVAMKHGDIEVKGVPLDRAYYIIFELADGDSRAQMEVSEKRNFAWAFRALHNVSSGLQSLHARDVYHQDLKPSNVLVFANGKENKLADLGRSHRENVQSPNGDWAIPGFIAYAPPEQLYGFEMPDARKRRAAADLYQLGSLILFFFSGVMATPALLSYLSQEHRPAGEVGWQGDFEAVLPYLEAAFASVAEELEVTLAGEIPEKYCDRLLRPTVRLFRELSAPAPSDRGHYVARRANASRPFDLQRIVSELAHLSSIAELVDRANAAAA